MCENTLDLTPFDPFFQNIVEQKTSVCETNDRVSETRRVWSSGWSIVLLERSACDLVVAYDVAPLLDARRELTERRSPRLSGGCRHECAT